MKGLTGDCDITGTQVWHEYIQPDSIDGVLSILREKRGRARVVAGATDLILELERGVRSGIDCLVDITRIPALNRIHMGDDGIIRLGPLVTHNDCVASPVVRERAYPCLLYTSPSPRDCS